MSGAKALLFLPRAFLIYIETALKRRRHLRRRGGPITPSSRAALHSLPSRVCTEILAERNVQNDDDYRMQQSMYNKIYKVMAAITGKGARGRREDKGIKSGKIS